MIMKTLLRLVSIFLLILLLLSRSAAFIPPSSSFAIALIGLGFPIFWILNSAILVLLMLFKIRLLRLTTCLVLLLTTPMMLRYYSLQLKSEKSDQCYSIFDFNAFGLRKPAGVSNQSDNQDSIHDFINDYKFTLACFQEYPMKGSKHAKFYEKLHNGLNLMHKSLSEYSANEKSTQLILVTASAFPIVNKELLYINSKPFALVTDIQFPEGIIRVFNIHLQSVKLTKERRLLLLHKDYHIMAILEQLSSTIMKLKTAFNNREKESILLSESIKSSPYPVIVAGDFNDTPASFTYQKISTGLKDASSGTAKGSKRTYKFSTMPLNIDYILHDNDISSSGYKHFSSAISDHYAISSKFRINAWQ